MLLRALYASILAIQNLFFVFFAKNVGVILKCHQCNSTSEALCKDSMRINEAVNSHFQWGVSISKFKRRGRVAANTMLVHFTLWQHGRMAEQSLHYYI